MIVGGFGGLGRAIIEWMVIKGARNLLVPWRSGASSQTALDLVTRLRSSGVRVETPQCDVSCSTELSKDLQDSIFSNITHEQWT